MAPVAVPANTLTSSACCTPAPPGVNGTQRGDRVDAEHEQHVAAPSRRRRTRRAGTRTRRSGTASRRTARARPRGSSGGGRTGSSRPGARAPRTPARARTAARSRPAPAIPSTVSRNSVKRGCEAKKREVERAELGEVRRLREHALGEREDRAPGSAIGVEDRLDEERRRRPPGSVEFGIDVLTRNSLMTSPPRAGTTLLKP